MALNDPSTSAILQPTAFHNCFNYTRYHPGRWYSAASLLSCTLYKKSHKTLLTNDRSQPLLHTSCRASCQGSPNLCRTTSNSTCCVHSKRNLKNIKERDETASKVAAQFDTIGEGEFEVKKDKFPVDVMGTQNGGCGEFCT